MDVFLRIFIPVYMIVLFLTAIVLPSYLLYKRTGIDPINNFHHKHGLLT